MLHQLTAIEFPDDVRERLMRLAAALRVPVQSVIVEAVRRYLEREAPAVEPPEEPASIPCNHCEGTGFVEATRFDGADAGACGECRGTGRRPNPLAPE